MGKAKRQARKATKAKVANAKAENKANVKIAKSTKKSTKKVGRVEKRRTTGEARTEKRKNASIGRTEKRAGMSAIRTKKRAIVGQKRVTKRLQRKLEKKYGEVDDSVLDQIEDVAPYIPEMANSLQEDGIELEDPNDPIEVATKYVQTDPDQPDPIPDDVYDDAFVNPDDMYFGTDEEFEHFEWKKIALGAVKGAFGSVASDATSHVNELADRDALYKRAERKKASGQKLSEEENDALARPLTDKEKKIVAVSSNVRRDVRQTVGAVALNKAQDYALPALGILLLILLLKKYM